MNPKYNWLFALILVAGVAATGYQIQKATQTQVDAGTDDSRFVTPYTLANKTGLGGSTNNVTFTGSTVIRTNALVDSTGSATISPTNFLEAVWTNGLKSLNVARNDGKVYAGTNVVILGDRITIDPYVTLRSDGGDIYLGMSNSKWLTFQTANTSRWFIDEVGHLRTGTDNTYDIGASITRPRNINAGSAGVFGTTVTATNGLATFSTTATNSIAATGITNTSAFIRHAQVTQTAVAFAIKNYEGTIIHNQASGTATHCIPLQPGGAITAASGLSGTLLPY